MIELLMVMSFLLLENQNILYCVYGNVRSLQMMISLHIQVIM